MINIFRQIRRKMIKENKFNKFLFYAFGEILLVVIGILIALSINNLNEDQKARVYEKKMLVEIKNALEKDVEFFENHLIGNRLHRIEIASRFFENYLLSGSINEDSINYHYNGLTNGLQITYNKGPYEALKSTGIDRVLNDSLRNMIIDLYEFQLPRQCGLITLYMDVYMTSSKSHEEALRDDLEVDIQNGKVVYFYNRMKKVDLKTNQSFLTLLSWASSSYKSVGGLFNTIIPRMETLILELDKELNKK